MPEGTKGQKRPADVIGAAIKVAKIASCRELLLIHLPGVVLDHLPGLLSAGSYFGVCATGFE